MGYNTEFEGSITITPALSMQERDRVNAFCQERHDEDRNAPSIWCDWRVNLAGTALSWNGSEKSYEMDKWLKIIINSLPAHTFNGKLFARGEEFGDMWTLSVGHRTVVRTNGW